MLRGAKNVNVRCIVFYCKARPQSLAKKLLVDDKITTYVQQILLLSVKRKVSDRKTLPVW